MNVLAAHFFFLVCTVPYFVFFFSLCCVSKLFQMPRCTFKALKKEEERRKKETSRSYTLLLLLFLGDSNRAGTLIKKKKETLSFSFLSLLLCYYYYYCSFCCTWQCRRISSPHTVLFYLTASVPCTHTHTYTSALSHTSLPYCTARCFMNGAGKCPSKTEHFFFRAFKKSRKAPQLLWLSFFLLLNIDPTFRFYY